MTPPTWSLHHSFSLFSLLSHFSHPHLHSPISIFCYLHVDLFHLPSLTNLTFVSLRTLSPSSDPSRWERLFPLQWAGAGTIFLKSGECEYDPVRFANIKETWISQQLKVNFTLSVQRSITRTHTTHHTLSVYSCMLSLSLSRHFLVLCHFRWLI